MPKTVKLTPPLTNEDVRNLEIGDKVLVSGVIYTPSGPALGNLGVVFRRGCTRH